MKKRYFSPTITVVCIETTNMIALSGTLDRNQAITSSDAFGARDGGFFDDEEDY